MILINENIWNTRIQSVGFLLTAEHQHKIEIYYAAIVCQVSIDEMLLSISINPDFPIFDLIKKSGKIGVNQVSANQSALIDTCVNLPIHATDKLSQLNLEFEYGQNSVPLLLDCMQSLECEVHQIYDGSNADHAMFICKVISRKVRDTRRHEPPQLYGRSPTCSKINTVKNAFLHSGIYGFLARIRQFIKPPLDIEQGTAIFCGIQAPIKRNLGICLTGCGWWGQVHAEALKTLGNQVRYYFVSHKPEQSQLFEKRFNGAGTFSSLEEAVANDKIDAVIICLPHTLHASETMKALNAGKHVLVEKPITLNMTDCQNLITVAQQKHLIFAVAEQYRVSPMIKLVQTFIRNNSIGQVHAVRVTVASVFNPQKKWKLTQKEMGGGILLDVGIHYISVLRMLFGKVTSTHATQSTGGYSGIEGEDTVTMQLGFDGGIIADIFLSWSCYADSSQPEIEILGNKGCLQFSLAGDKVVFTKPLPANHWSNRLRQTLPWRIVKIIDKFLPTQKVNIINPNPSKKSLHQLLLEEFIYCIEHKTNSNISAEEGAEDLRVILDAYQRLTKI